MKFFVITVYLYLIPLQARTIAFIKAYNRQGQLIQMEKDGIFAHVAIEFQEGWIHTHPFRGIVKVKNLQDIGFYNFEVQEIEVTEKYVDQNFLEQALGKKYDHHYSWSDDAYYCSELIAKALNLRPVPMKFDPEIWGDRYQDLNGLPGISPDGLFLMLKKLSQGDTTSKFR
jgi:hypothetical protein